MFNEKPIEEDVWESNPAGEILVTDGEVLQSQVAEYEDCVDCAFYPLKCIHDLPFGCCTGSLRTDGQHVTFRKVTDYEN